MVALRLDSEISGQTAVAIGPEHAKRTLQYRQLHVALIDSQTVQHRPLTGTPRKGGLLTGASNFAVLFIGGAYIGVCLRYGVIWFNLVAATCLSGLLSVLEGLQDQFATKIYNL